jgi:hypothetical protein
MGAHRGMAPHRAIELDRHLGIAFIRRLTDLFGQ